MPEPARKARAIGIDAAPPAVVAASISDHSGEEGDFGLCCDVGSRDSLDVSQQNAERLVFCPMPVEKVIGVSRPVIRSFATPHRPARSGTWLIPVVAAVMAAAALPALAGPAPAVWAGLPSAARTSVATASSPERAIEVVAASPKWAVIVSSELKAGGLRTGYDDVFIVDAEGNVEYLASDTPYKRFVGWSLAKNMLVANSSDQLPGQHNVAVWWNLRTGSGGARRVATSYMYLVAAAPHGWLMRRYSTGALVHSDVDGNRTKFAEPFAAPRKYYDAYAGPMGVLVTGNNGRFRYLPWVHPDRDRKLPQRLAAILNYTCPTVTVHAAYCVADVGKKPHVGSEVVFLDGGTPAVNVRTFARNRGVELLLPPTTDYPQLATATSREVSLANAHGRIVTLLFDRRTVKRANGWVTDVSQVTRGLSAVLIVGEEGVYKLSGPTGKPHLLAAAADLA